MPTNDSSSPRFSRAKQVLKALIEGVHPKTCKELPQDTIVNDIEVHRALLVAIVAIDQVQARAARRALLPDGVGKNWSPDEERALVVEFRAGERIPDIAIKHQRTIRAIEARLERLGLITADQRTTANSFTGSTTVGTDTDRPITTEGGTEGSNEQA